MFPAILTIIKVIPRTTRSLLAVKNIGITRIYSNMYLHISRISSTLGVNFGFMCKGLHILDLTIQFLQTAKLLRRQDNRHSSIHLEVMPYMNFGFLCKGLHNRFFDNPILGGPFKNFGIITPDSA